MIKIKTPIDKINYTLSMNKILVPVTNTETGEEEIKEIVVNGNPIFDPLEIDIMDELDPKKWIRSVYNNNKIKSPLHYKKNLEVEDKSGNIYELWGRFPIEMEQNKITISFDNLSVKGSSLPV